MIKSVLIQKPIVAMLFMVATGALAQRPLREVGATCIVARTVVFEGEPVPVDIHFDNRLDTGIRYSVGLEWQSWDPNDKSWRSDAPVVAQAQVAVRRGLSVHFVRDSLGAASNRPGKWRVRARCGQPDDPMAERLRAELCFATPWTEVVIMEHAGNRDVLEGKRGLAAQEAMRNALSGSEPWTTPQLFALLGLRSLGVSPRIAARSELVAARPALRRLAGSPPGPQVEEEATDLRKVILRAGESIDDEAGNWGGLRGDFLEERYMLEGVLETPEQEHLANQIRIEYPGRFEELRQRWDELRRKAQQRYGGR